MNLAPRTNGSRAAARRSLLLLLSLAACAYALAPGARLPRWVSVPSASAATVYTVTTNADGGPGSLRQAITDANSSAGTDMINFNLPAGQLTITLLSDLPLITDPVVIDGTTQPGYAGAPVVELNGNSSGRNFTSNAGLRVRGGSSTVRGLVINRFTSAGVELATNGGNVVENCYIGVDPTGAQRRANAIGIDVVSSQNRIGGPSPAQRNVISGNTGHGITTTGGNVIQGNYIGTDAAGASAIDNSGSFAGGIFVSLSPEETLIGGTVAGAGNVISGNSNFGISVNGGNVTIQGNFIGTDATGMLAIPNFGNGIHSTGGHRIGGTTPDARNVIGGNRMSGILIDRGTAGGVVEGNYIGVAADGRSPLPNSLVPFGFNQAGVFVRSSQTNRIGGSEPGQGNMIAYNNSPGVVVASALGGAAQPGTTVRGNSIFSNVNLGIDLGRDNLLGGDNVTPNDAGDADLGPNNRQNFPLITDYSSVGGTTTVAGTLASLASTAYDVDFYASRACDPLGNGEGAAYLGSAQVVTDAAGNAAFNVVLARAIPPGRVVTATATAPDGSTSEFSPCDATRVTAAGIAFQTTRFAAIEDVGTLNVTVIRPGSNLSETITVGYETFGGTATEGVDYLPVSGTLTFDPGDRLKTIPVQIINDSIFESVAAETIYLRLTTLGEPEVLVLPAATIIELFDNSTTPTVAALPTLFTEGSGGGSPNRILSIGLSAATSRTVSVDYVTVSDFGSTAAPGADYLPVAGTVTFNPGETRKEVPIPIVADTIDEFNETFRVLVLNPVNAGLGVGNNPAPMTITDDDEPPTISVGDVTVTEGTGGTTQAVFPVTLSSVSGKPMSVAVTVAPGTAAAGSDYTPPATPTVINIEPGQTVTSFSVAVVADSVDEADETFFVDFAPGQNVTITRARGTATIADDDGEPRPTLSISGSNRPEDQIGGAAIFAVSLSAASAHTVTVQFATSDGTAAAGSDYAALSGTLTFAPGETQKTIAVPVTPDAAVEPDETFSVTLSNPTNATIATAAATGVIVNDDRAFAFAAATFNASEGGGRATVEVTRSGFAGAADEVGYGTLDDHTPVPCADVTGTAFARCDYTTTVDRLVFAPGETTKTFTVPLVDDSHAEGAETFKVFIDSPVGPRQQATVAVADNEAGASGPNPIDTHPFFVRQHYLDFLSREPEASGLAAWLNVLNICPNAFNTSPTSASAGCDRNTVSSSFFRAPEFEFKGLFVFRFYRATLGRLPLYSEIVRDMSAVSGQTPQEVFARRAAFAERWAQRGEFVAFLQTDTPRSLVLSWMNRVQLTQVTTPDPADPEGAQKVVLTAQQLADRVAAGTLTLGQAARAIADSDEVKAAEFRPAFVAMQYFGYLRRDPEVTGFNNWLNYLDANPDDFRTMIDGFMNSVEYRLRFGPR